SIRSFSRCSPAAGATPAPGIPRSWGESLLDSSSGASPPSPNVSVGSGGRSEPGVVVVAGSGTGAGRGGDAQRQPAVLDAGRRGAGRGDRRSHRCTVLGPAAGGGRGRSAAAVRRAPVGADQTAQQHTGGAYRCGCPGGAACDRGGRWQRACRAGETARAGGGGRRGCSWYGVDGGD